MKEENKQYDVIFVVLPWAPINSPSLQVGLLKAVAERVGISSQTAHLNVEFFKYVKEHGPSVSVSTDTNSHDNLKNLSTAAPWIFAVPPVFNDSQTITAHFNRLRQNRREEELKEFEISLRLRELVPAFFKKCAEDILRMKPKVVGFSCTFNQRIPSLVLAKMLKQVEPAIKIVFGGTYMDGVMGAAFSRAFSWVDVVVRGEAEKILPGLLQDLLSESGEIGPQPGLCIRKGDNVDIHPESPETKAELNEGPLPDYDEYFEKIEGTDLVQPGIVSVSMETSRGCWWYKSKCKFCGRSEYNLKYRSKSLDKVAAEFRTLSEKYRQLDFTVVDPAIRAGFMAKLMAGFEQDGLNFQVWCQSRVKYKKQELETMARNGVKTIFLGIESLSTPVLEIMRKGHTALEAIEVLKWGLEFGVTITWNMIHQFPSELPEHYEKMADMMESLTHLSPPFHLARLNIDRSSVFFDNPQEYSITLHDPYPMKEPIFYLAKELGHEDQIRDLADHLDATFDKIDPVYGERCREILNRWREGSRFNLRKLSYRRGEGFIQIIDCRSNLEQQVITLGQMEADIYQACDSPKTSEDVWKTLDPEYRDQLSIEDVEEFLDQAVDIRIAYSENGRYISLAVPEP